MHSYTCIHECGAAADQNVDLYILLLETHLLSRCSVICVHNCVYMYGGELCMWCRSIVQSIWRHAIMQVPLLIPKGPCRVELYPIWDSSIFCKSFSTLEWRGAAIVPKEHAPLIEAHHWPRPLYMQYCCRSTAVKYCHTLTIYWYALWLFAYT